MAILDLPEGEHQYKFFVDGQWVHDPSEVRPGSPRVTADLRASFQPSLPLVADVIAVRANGQRFSW